MNQLIKISLVLLEIAHDVILISVWVGDPNEPLPPQRVWLRHLVDPSPNGTNFPLYCYECVLRRYSGGNW